MNSRIKKRLDVLEQRQQKQAQYRQDAWRWNDEERLLKIATLLTRAYQRQQSGQPAETHTSSGKLTERLLAYLDSERAHWPPQLVTLFELVQENVTGKPRGLPSGEQ